MAGTLRQSCTIISCNSKILKRYNAHPCPLNELCLAIRKIGQQHHILKPFFQKQVTFATRFKNTCSSGSNNYVKAVRKCNLPRNLFIVFALSPKSLYFYTRFPSSLRIRQTRSRARLLDLVDVWYKQLRIAGFLPWTVSFCRGNKEYAVEGKKSHRSPFLPCFFRVRFFARPLKVPSETLN